MMAGSGAPQVGGVLVGEGAAAIEERPHGASGRATTFARWCHLGDTGFHEAPFAHIGRSFPSGFDLALIPIGAYEPRWFMREQHVDPDDAVVIHRTIGSRRSLGMHWGTFILTDEPIDEPPVKLAHAMLKYYPLREDGTPTTPSSKLHRDVFSAPAHGESVVCATAHGIP